MVATSKKDRLTNPHASNRRVRKTVSNGGLAANIPNGTTDCIWMGWQAMEERNPFGGSGGTDTPTKQYVWGTYIDECIQIKTLTTLGPQNLPVGNYYLLQDTLYRAAALTDSSGAVVEAYDCDAYGNTLIFTAADSSGNWWGDSATQSNYGANDIIFCGYRFDPEIENYYVRNRNYSPVLGRWLTRDPIGYSGGINLYEYVGGRPVALTDPQGKDSCEKEALDCEHNCLRAYNFAEKVIGAFFNACRRNCTSSWDPAICLEVCELRAGTEGNIAGAALVACNTACNVQRAACELVKCVPKLLPKPPPGPQLWPWPPISD